MFSALSRSTRFVTSIALALSCFGSAALADAKVEILRTAILSNGLEPPKDRSALSDAAAIGKAIFESRALSLNGEISCQQCHLDEFGTSDGIPLSVGVSGSGEGSERIRSAYRFLARNSLPLWGRGASDFRTFFWDGRVDAATGEIISQFGDEPPSDDPLVVAVHLPPVETVEMLEFDNLIAQHRQEDIETANQLYGLIADHLKEREPEITSRLADHLGKGQADIGFIDIATSLAAFIRDNFPIRETRLHQFAFGEETLSPDELEGGLVFYGKGRCSACHSGPHFSDLRFHVVPFPQLGQGRNGFGVDYGRFNVTHDPGDLYRFRTTPLWDVWNTAPYGHSGSLATLEEAIRAHFDPLALIDTSTMSPLERHEFFKRMSASKGIITVVSYLSDEEIQKVGAFLKLLNQSTP